MKIKNILLLFALALLFACEPKIDTVTTTAGDADFTKFVSIGSSLTSGYADGDLYKSGQKNSYPAILAKQFEEVGGGEFKQPLMFDEYGFGNRFLLDASLKVPVPAGVTPDARNSDNIYAIDGPFNNMGVPGAKSYHLLAPGYGNPAGVTTVPPTANPYFVRFASSTETTVLADAFAQNPTFFTLWIGNNDVLAYALAGGAAESITDINTFSYSIDFILNQMTANNAKGAVANIPDITSIPFFATIPYYGLVLERQGQADTLNAVYLQIGAQLGYNYNFNFKLGPNAFLVSDASLPIPSPYNVRQMKPGELILLPALTAIKTQGMGSLDISGATPVPYGIPDNLYLSLIEVGNIATATNAFNGVIATLANSKGLAFVDMNAKLKEIATTGVVYDGVPFSAAFVSGNSFSLDGVHMTAQGNALAANYFIDAINAKYNSVLKHVSPRMFPGIYYY